MGQENRESLLSISEKTIGSIYVIKKRVCVFLDTNYDSYYTFLYENTRVKCLKNDDKCLEFEVLTSNVWESQSFSTLVGSQIDECLVPI